MTKQINLKINYPNHECEPEYVVFSVPNCVDDYEFYDTASMIFAAGANHDDDYLTQLDSCLESLAKAFCGSYNIIDMNWYSVDAGF